MKALLSSILIVSMWATYSWVRFLSIQILKSLCYLLYASIKNVDIKFLLTLSFWFSCWIEMWAANFQPTSGIFFDFLLFSMKTDFSMKSNFSTRSDFYTKSDFPNKGNIYKRSSSRRGRNLCGRTYLMF